MKRIFATLLAVLMVLSLAACSPQINQTEPHTHNHTHEESTTAFEETQSVESIETTTSQEDASQPASTDAPATSESANLSRGSIENNTYTSSSTGLTFTKPSDWTYLTDEQLAEKIDVSTQELSKDIFPSTAERVPAVYDMWAIDEKNNINISVAYENMHVTASVAMTTDQYMEMLEGAFENTEGTALIQKSTVDLSGKMYQKAIFTTEIGGTSTQSIYYLRAMGKFMNIVLVTAPADTELPEIEKLFN